MDNMDYEPAKCNRKKAILRLLAFPKQERESYPETVLVFALLLYTGMSEIEIGFLSTDPVLRAKYNI